MPAENKNKYKEALLRYNRHLQEVAAATGVLPRGDDSETTQRIRTCRADYATFCRTYFPHLATSPCGKFQAEAAEYIKNNPRARCVFEWARGHAKSSHISLMIPLWLLIQDKSTPLVMVLVSKSSDSARRLLSDLQAELTANELYTHDYGNQRGSGTWTDGEFITTAGSLFIALGRGQSPRGIKKQGLRVNYISIDDIDDDELCRNPHRIDNAVDWCLTALYGTMAMGRGRFILVGNRISGYSILSQIAERPHFHHTKVNALDSKGLPTWLENYTSAEIASIRTEVGERRFQKEYMNNPVSEGTIFERKYIHYAPCLPLRQYRHIIAYTDPSFKSSPTADYKATMLVGITSQGIYHVLKAYADQTKITDMVAWHYQIQQYIGDTPCRYYIETGFIQDLIIDEFHKVGRAVGNQIPIIGDPRKKPEKFARIEALQPLFQRGEIIFNQKEQTSQGMRVLEDQLLMFQRGSRAHDDAPDALEGAIYLLGRLRRTSDFPSLLGMRTRNNNIW